MSFALVMRLLLIVLVVFFLLLSALLPVMLQLYFVVSLVLSLELLAVSLLLPPALLRFLGILQQLSFILLPVLFLLRFAFLLVLLQPSFTLLLVLILLPSSVLGILLQLRFTLLVLLQLNSVPGFLHDFPNSLLPLFADSLLLPFLDVLSFLLHLLSVLVEREDRFFFFFFSRKFIHDTVIFLLGDSAYKIIEVKRRVRLLIFLIKVIKFFPLSNSKRVCLSIMNKLFQRFSFIRARAHAHDAQMGWLPLNYPFQNLTIIY